VGRYRRRGTRFLTKSELARKFLLEKRLSPEQVTTVGVGIDAELLRDRPDAGQTELEQKMRAQKTGLKLLYIGRIEPPSSCWMCWPKCGKATRTPAFTSSATATRSMWTA
jgi:hypothetical protein